MLRLEVIEVELEDGTRSQREIIRHPGAVAVLAHTAKGQCLLVRQYRKAVEEEMEEVIAGTLDPGEDPEACARREVEEETGHRVGRIERLGVIYPSPGYLDEKITVFRADVSPCMDPASADLDERVEAVTRDEQEIESAIASGAIRDAKTLAAWSLHRLIPPGKQSGQP